MMTKSTNVRRVEIEGVAYDVPVELYARARAEAELRVQRRMLVELAAELAAHDEHVEHAAQLLAEWNRHEDRLRARLRLPARGAQAP